MLAYAGRLRCGKQRGRRGPAAVLAASTTRGSQLNSLSVRWKRKAQRAPVRSQDAPPGPCYLLAMSTIRARVQKGRLILDEPTALPEGTVLDLVVDDEGDDLDEAERASLNQAISRAWASVRAGEGRPADEVLTSLRKR